MDPNNPNPYQQPGTPQSGQVPQQPIQPEAQFGQPQVNQYGPQQPMQPVQPVYSQPQPMYGQNSMPSSGSKGKIVAIIGGVVVLIVIIVLAIVLLGHKNNGSTGSSSSGSSQNSNSSGASASSATTSKTACQLFTLADAQSAIGPGASTGQAQPAQTKNNNTQSICIYGSDSNSLTIVVEVATNSAGKSSQESDFSKALSVSGTISVSGLGDKALYGKPSYGGEKIEVIQGNVLFVISANSGSQSTLTTMAQTILNNF